MKRSASSTPPSSPLVTPKSEHNTHGNDEDYTPATELSENRTPSKKPRANHGTSPKKTKTQSKSFKVDHDSVSASVSNSVAGSGWESGWTPDKKEAIVERLISLGIKCANMSELSREFNLTKTQLGNALQVGHKGNLREKAAKGVRG